MPITRLARDLPPLFVAGDALAEGKLVQILPAWKLPEQGIHAVTTSRELPTKTRAFIDFFGKTIGDPPRWEVPSM